MQFFTQDDNFEMMHLTDDENLIETIEHFEFPWEESGDVVEASINDMKCGGKIRISRHLHVTQNYSPKNRKNAPTDMNYESMIGPFFATYMQEYVERQDGKYDELLSTVRKLLKVKITGKTTKKLICLNDKGKYCLTCIDITKDKATWRKDDFKMTLRYFEFSMKKTGGCSNNQCCPTGQCCTEVTTVDASVPAQFPEPGPVSTVPTVPAVPAVPIENYHIPDAPIKDEVDAPENVPVQLTIEVDDHEEIEGGEFVQVTEQ